MASISEVWLAEYPALTRAQGLPAAAGRPQALGFTEFAGNRQIATVGNVSAEDRVALFPDGLSQPAPAEDPRTHDLAAEPELASQRGNTGDRARPERAFTLKL